MTSGGFEKVIPMIVGVVVFVMITAFLVNDFNTTLPSGVAGPDNTPPNRYTMHQISYDMFKPQGNPGYSWFAKNSTGIIDHYYAPVPPYDHPGVLGAPDIEWKGSSGQGPYYTMIVRNNTLWDSAKFPTNETLSSQSNFKYDLYKDYIAVEYARYTWLKVPGISWWLQAFSFGDIIDRFQGNVSSMYLGDTANTTLFISISASWGNTEIGRANALYSNNFTISMGHQIDESVNWYTVVWYILTFNTGWMSSNPFIALIISSIVDMTIILAVVRIIQGFIP